MSRPTSGARGPSGRARPVERVEDAPGAVRGTEALQLERAGILDDEAAGREPVRRRADEDLARRALPAGGALRG